MAEWLSAIATVGICVIAFFQLKGLRDNITLQIVFDMERELHERKKLLDTIASEIQEQYLNEPSKESVYILKLKLSTAAENYLNAIERLAFLILKKYLRGRQWEREYKELIVGIVNHNPDRFGVTTPYTNIVKLYTKWKDT